MLFYIFIKYRILSFDFSVGYITFKDKGIFWVNKLGKVFIGIEIIFLNFWCIRNKFLVRVLVIVYVWLIVCF